MDDGFCYDYDIDYNFETKESTVRVFWTSKRLISLTQYNNHVHCDATYKLNWNGYSVILLGTTDAAKAFHPYGLALCKSEKDEDYAFAFNAVKKAVLEFHGVDFKPKYLVADAAQAISNGFGLALGFKPVRIMCWYHMKTKVEDALSKVTKTHRDQLLNEIVIMQQFASKDVFEHASHLAAQVA